MNKCKWCEGEIVIGKRGIKSAFCSSNCRISDWRYRNPKPKKVYYIVCVRCLDTCLRTASTQKYCTKCRAFIRKKHAEQLTINNKANHKIACLKYAKANKDKIDAYSRDKSREDVFTMSDTYIKALLRHQQIVNPSREQIEQKRLALKLKRKIDEIQRKIKSSGNHGRTNDVLPRTNTIRSNKPKHAKHH